MAIQLSANYSKKLGLPQYSSHSFAASIQIELSDINQAEAEIQKLYQLLQQSVDQEIQHSGFIPQAQGSISQPKQQSARTYQATPSNRPHNQPRPMPDRWNCTDGQKGFIQRIINESNLQIRDAEDLSQQLFHLSVKELNKMQASQLIEDLLVKAGKPAPRQTRWQRPAQQAA